MDTFPYLLKKKSKKKKKKQKQKQNQQQCKLKHGKQWMLKKMVEEY